LRKGLALVRNEGSFLGKVVKVYLFVNLFSSQAIQNKKVKLAIHMHESRTYFGIPEAGLFSGPHPANLANGTSASPDPESQHFLRPGTPRRWAL
jgi:hypothetical protein